MPRRLGWLVAAAALAWVLPEGKGLAQTADELFDDSVLQRIDLYVNTRDWAQLQATYQENTFYPADLRWRGQTVRNAGIRSRGYGSRSATKPGLLVDFDRYTTDQRFLGLKSLVLDNLWQDPSGLHETVAMRFYRRMGLPASREAHAALYVNNAFFGLYAIVENVDEVAAARMLGEGNGYLFEFHWTYEYRFEYLGPSFEPYAALLEARTHEHESSFNLYSPIETMIRLINEAADEDFVSAVSTYLDLEEFVKRTAVQNFLGQWDGLLGYAGLNNFYLYRYQGRNLSRILPWDEDVAVTELDWPILANHDQFVLMRRAMAVPSLRDLYYQTLLEAVAAASELAEGDPSDDTGAAAPGWLEREVTRQALLIRDPMLADVRKPFSSDEVTSAWNRVVRFARFRAALVACQVQKYTDPRHADDACSAPADDGSVVLPASDRQLDRLRRTKVRR